MGKGAVSHDPDRSQALEQPPSARLFVPLLVTLLLPALYISLRVRLLNLSLDPSELGVVTQLQWVSLLFEILKDSLLALAVFHLGAVHQDRVRLEARWINALYLVAGAHALLALLIALFDTSLLEHFAYAGLPVEHAATYLRLEAISQLPAALMAVMQAALLVLGKSRWLYVTAVGQLLASALTDSLLIPLAGNAQGQSIGWVAISPGIAASLTLLVTLVLLHKSGFLQQTALTPDGVGRWLLRSVPAALECTLRNAVFAWMILRLANVSGESNLFWNTNQFIWTWILLPVFALGLLVRRDAATSTSSCLQAPRFYVIGVMVCALVWIGSSSLWPDWIGLAMGYESPQAAAALADSQIGFYLVFCIGYLLTQHFLGKGRTGVLLLNTAIVNLGYYGFAFIAYHAALWQPDLSGIVRLFGWGLVTGTVTLILQYTWLQHRDRFVCSQP